MDLNVTVMDGVLITNRPFDSELILETVFVTIPDVSDGSMEVASVKEMASVSLTS